MKHLFFIVTIILVAVNNNTIEILVSKNYEPSVIMVYRSIIAILLFLIIGLVSKNSLKPNNIKLQLIRLFIDGLSIWLLYTSYKYLSAGTVALFQRLDIPCLIIISVIFGLKKSSLQFYLSVWVIIIVSYFIADAKTLDEDPLGFVYALLGVLFLSITFYMLKKQTESENNFSLGFIYSLSMILWGIFISFFAGINLRIYLIDFWIFVLGGILQFIIVYLALRLFKMYSAEKARLPFIIGAIATLGLEMIIEQKLFSFNYIFLSLILSGIVATVCLDPDVPIRKLNKI